MNLSTLFFVFAFLPVSLILYLVCPRVCKNALLVLISFVFYAWGSPVYLLLLLLVTVFNYCVGLDIGNRAESGQRGTKFLLVIGVLFNLLLLGFYKYAAFAIETLNAILPFTLNAPSAALPLGISFFTFQNLSYLSDVYHRRAPAQKNPLDFCLYVSFFPKMISGPIVEYAQFEPQLKSHPVTLYKVSEAVPMLVLGLAKRCCWPIISVLRSRVFLHSHPVRFPAGRRGSARSAIRFSSTSTSAAIPTWPSAWRSCSASTLTPTSTIPTSLLP